MEPAIAEVLTATENLTAISEKAYGTRDSGSSYDDRKPYGDKREGSGDKKPYGTRDSGSSYGDRKPYGDKREGSGDKKPYGNREGGSSYGEKKPYGDKREDSGDRRPFGYREGGKTFEDRKAYGDKGKRAESGDRKPYGNREGGSSSEDREVYGHKRKSETSDERKAPRERKEFDGNKPFRPKSDEDRKPFVSTDRDFKREDRPYEPREHHGERSDYKDRDGKSPRKRFDERSTEGQDDQIRLKSSESNRSFKKDDGLIRLNRFIANSGICSRRKADELIASGVVSVNGEAVTELGTKVNPAVDQIKYNGEILKREKMVYVLLNKPKDYITTTDDPQERKTVMELISKATNERIYPVGRLDRNTTGLLLMTNDGDLADKLSHPKNSISKIYNVELDKNLTQGDFNKIAFGVELEDGLIKPDEVSYVRGGAKNEIGIQIHSGKNRIVRRIFESLGYEVVKLDRVIYANLTKKDLTRGRWRYLTEKEVIQLKHFTKG
ncbi:pseudouridine synthase [Pedobacter arcticus]|uniref:pseudouridine synthase n=1 Tax=Pedobacter arcticus TaxID=752140 RepID=UPI00031DB1D3|nr:pseudouridine synthase [Pedobacter arcticus]